MAADDDLFAAIAAGDADRVTAILAADPGAAERPNGAGLSPVRAARYRGQAAIVAAILAAAPTLDVFDAASVGDVERLEVLLGDDPGRARAMSWDGATALHFAAIFAQADAAAVLISAGADVNAVAVGFNSVTPLHSAAAGNDERIVERLLAAGALPNVRQGGGFTPLHAAAQNGNLAAVDLLLEAGADPTLAADDGQRAIDFARDAGHAAVVERLEPLERGG